MSTPRHEVIEAAVARFPGAYGAPLDWTSAGDLADLLDLIDQELRWRERQVARVVEQRTVRLEGAA